MCKEDNSTDNLLTPNERRFFQYAGVIFFLVFCLLLPCSDYYFGTNIGWSVEEKVQGFINETLKYNYPQYNECSAMAGFEVFIQILFEVFMRLAFFPIHMTLHLSGSISWFLQNMSCTVDCPIFSDLCLTEFHTIKQKFIGIP